MGTSEQRTQPEHCDLVHHETGDGRHGGKPVDTVSASTRSLAAPRLRSASTSAVTANEV